MAYTTEIPESATCNILKDEVINYGGPWWFMQLWLNMYTRLAVDKPSLALSAFPTTYADDEKANTRRCMSFGEATIVYSGENQSVDGFKGWFFIFYDGSALAARMWFAYDTFSNFDLPENLRLNYQNNPIDSRSRDNFILVTFLRNILFTRYTYCSYEDVEWSSGGGSCHGVHH
ncbi:hypothetical protein OsJ_30965 [Oryza sativa Japonica Group]|uniref:Uncharacterized protein n=1 Tax=Oryza sativa subsp. japonica TaxID=39947 RepID=B9G7W1_ORYSJ|nr:hypothetical protein OsJ_30965 [Oryza sativa Japonica Group]